MNLIIKLQIDKLYKSKKCNMKSISDVSAKASELNLIALLTWVYNHQEEYLQYIEKKKY